MKPKPTRLERWAHLFAYLWIASFAAFALSTYLFGGEAVSGGHIGGQYYLGYKTTKIEVSKEVFFCSLSVVWLWWVCTMLAILSSLLVRYCKWRATPPGSPYDR